MLKNIKPSLPDFPFPCDTPEAVGIPSAAVLGFLRALENHPYRLHAMMLVRNGKLCFSAASSPYTLQTPHRVYSAGKSILALSALFAMQEGKLCADDPVTRYFPEASGTRFDRMTVSDLLTMRSGQTEDPFPILLKDLDADLIRAFFQTLPTDEPGKTFRYNNSIPHIVYAVTERATGIPFEQYQQSHLLDPLNAQIFAPTNPQGQYNPVVMSMSAITLMKIALFYMQKGVWEGRQLLDSHWIDEATASHTATGMAGNAAEYGYQIWRNAFGGYRMDGGWGQYALILPEQGLAAVLFSDMPDSSFALEAFGKEIVARLSPSALPEDSAAHAALEAYAQAMSLAPKGGDADSAWRDEWFAKRYRFNDPDMVLSLSQEPNGVHLLLTQNDATSEYHCGLNGVWQINNRHFLVMPERTVDNGVYCLSPDECYLTGVWRGPEAFEMSGKSLGALGEYLYRFVFDKDGLTLTLPKRVCRGGPSLENAVSLHAEGSDKTDANSPA